jgi:long-chain fatty acid transport protein
MTYRGVKAVLLACCGAGAMLAMMADANAGGFAIREMSSKGQGSSYAGVAAGGDLSSMFWNPATMTQIPGVQAELSAAAVLPSSTNTPAAGSTLGFLGGTGNTANNALVPSGYFSWQFNRDMWFGVSVNAPFGLAVSFPTLWAGRDYAAGDTHLRTYNIAPSFAYRFSDMVSVGFGIQAQYADASLTRGVTLGGPTFLLANIAGTGWAYGFTAGITVTPTPATTLGVGYRSSLNQKINGTMAVPGLLPTVNVSTTLNLPDTVSFGLRQKLTSQWTGLATVEWSNWSRIGTSAVSGALVPTTLPFQYKDGWLLSAGAEYEWDPRLTLRGGVGFEKSPIADQVRIPLLPDNDRYWLSVGTTYKVTSKLSLDAAYSHLFVVNTPINVVPGNPWFNGATAYVGNVSSHIDIVSVALKYRFDDDTAPPKKMLVTK